MLKFVFVVTTFLTTCLIAASERPGPDTNTCYKDESAPECDAGELGRCGGLYSGSCGWVRYRVAKDANDFIKCILYFTNNVSANVDIHFGQCSLSIRDSKPFAVNGNTDFEYHHTFFTEDHAGNINFTFVPQKPKFGEQVFMGFNKSFIVLAYPNHHEIREGFYFDCPIEPDVIVGGIAEFWLDVFTWGIPDGRFRFEIGGLKMLRYYNGNFWILLLGIVAVVFIFALVCRRRRRSVSRSPFDDKEPLVAGIHLPQQDNDIYNPTTMHY